MGPTGRMYVFSVSDPLFRRVRCADRLRFAGSATDGPHSGPYETRKKSHEWVRRVGCTCLASRTPCFVGSAVRTVFGSRAPQRMVRTADPTKQGKSVH